MLIWKRYLCPCVESCISSLLTNNPIPFEIRFIIVSTPIVVTSKNISPRYTVTIFILHPRPGMSKITDRIVWRGWVIWGGVGVSPLRIIVISQLEEISTRLAARSLINPFCTELARLKMLGCVAIPILNPSVFIDNEITNIDGRIVWSEPDLGVDGDTTTGLNISPIDLNRYFSIRLIRTSYCLIPQEVSTYRSPSRSWRSPC
jgi:hypothetical protein